MKKILNPGSEEAIAAGCKCPVMENNHGRGYWLSKEGRPEFVMAGNCPLHGLPKEIEKNGEEKK